MQRKNFAATGSFVAEDRPRALDLLGFSSQLVFNTFHNRRLRDWEHGDDLDLADGVARAHNRGLVEFCAGDDRLLPTCYVPLADFDLATTIFDGVLERFPTLRIGVIEQGAIWVPSWLRQMEAAFDAFGRHEERLRALSLRPTEYVRRQVRVTPYPTEDVGWIIANSAPEICLFSSDYPHVEGGRRPRGRFHASPGDGAAANRRRSYSANCRAP